MKSAIFVPLFAPMGQGKSTEQAAGTGEGHEGFRVVKPARAPAPAPVPKYTAFSIPREALNAPPAAGSGLEDHDDVAPALPLVKPLIEGSAHAWILRPPGDTSKLDALDPAAVLAVQRELQMHLRRAHLLVDHSTVVVTQQMHDVEQQCAHTVLAFTRLVTASSGEMELLSHTADDLVAATRRAHAKISDMVQLTLRVRGFLSPEQQKQLDGGSALYRSARDSTAPDLVAATDSPTHGRTRSGSAMVALKQLHGSAASRKLSTQGADEARTADSQVELWLEELLPRWDTALDRKRCFAAARKGAGIPPSIRGAIWKRAIGNRLGVTVTQFEGLCVPVEGEDERSNSLDLIGHDVPRTFHRLKLFVNPSESFATDLLVVLQAFARLNFDLGYVQGMSYLAGMLLLNMCASDAWVALNNLIVDNHLFMSLYRMNVPGIVQHARIYEMILSESQPDAYAHLHTMGVTSDHYILDWWMTLFCRKLPLRLCTRIWDLYLVEGEIFLHKTAVALMKLHLRGLLHCADLEASVKELCNPVECEEEEFLALTDSVKVSAHWSAILERIQPSPRVSNRVRSRAGSPREEN